MIRGKHGQFAEIIQKHNAKIEAVPNLNGTPNEIITNQKSNLQTKNQRLKQINDELNKISEKHFASLVEVVEAEAAAFTSKVMIY